MRPLKALPFVLLLSIASPAYSQTITYSLLGHAREIGPIELSLFTYGLTTREKFIDITSKVQTDSTSSEQPPTGKIIGKAILGSVLGICASSAGAFLASDLYFRKPPYWIGIPLFFTLQPLIMARYVHKANNSQGHFLSVFLTAVPFWVGPLTYGLIAEPEGPSPIMLCSCIVQIPVTIWVERSTAARKQQSMRP